jgi:hypothetical protein
MALTATTLAGALGATALKANLTSATGVVVGSLLKIDDEYTLVQSIAGTWVSLMRGINGSVQCAHSAGAPAVHSSAPEDFASSIPKPRIYSYSAAGAITPAPGIHVIGIGAGGAHAMTLVDPPADQPGMLLHIVSASAYQHTITMGTGYGGTSGTDAFTLATEGVGLAITLMSKAGQWSLLATNLTSGEAVGATVA